MPEDILRFLGLEDPHIDQHPNKGITEFLGLSPDTLKDIPHDPYNLGSAEERFAAPPTKTPTTLQKIHQAIDPSTALPAAAKNVGSNIAEYASSGANMIGQGASDVLNNQSATGAGRVGIGALSTLLSPLSGVVKSGEDVLASVTGNPDFASKAALAVPFPVGKVGGAVAHAVAPSTRAADIIAQTAGSDMPEILARLRSNPRLRPIDTNDQLRMAGQGLIASPKSPDASRTLTQSMRGSAAEARDAVRGTYNETMGPPPNLFEEKTRLENKAKSIGLAKIAPPLIAAKPVDTSSVIQDIDKALNPAAVKMTPGTTITPTPLQQRLVELRQRLASGDKEVLTDADRLHEIQSDLRREAEDLMSSATGADRRLGRELKNYRTKLVNSIDAAAPGYKEGLKAYRDQKDIERAYEFGQSIAKNTDDIKTDPSYWEQWVNHKDRTPEELDAARLGARSAIERKMGSIKQSALDPARSGTDVPQIEFNRQKIEHLFGKENTDKMFKHLQDERDIALTNNRGLGNSKTAETQSWQKRLEPRDISHPSSQLPAWATMMGMGGYALTGNPTVGGLVGGGLLGARGAKSGYDWLARRGETSRNNALADLLTKNDPETLAILSNAAQRVSQRNKLNNLLAPP